jgi:AcrR family transcriptional regulator
VVGRDGARTKESILAAAEDLFARQGFERTSMHEIGELAGVARSTPAYFFGSKDALYDAVLARVVARAEKELAAGRGAGGRSSEEAGVTYVHALIDLLSDDENLVRLIQRESLREGTRMAAFLGRLADDAVAAFAATARQAGVSPQRLVLDAFALAWFPLAHAHTLPLALGMKSLEPAFLEEQKVHLVDVVRALTHIPACGSASRDSKRRAGR